jgi:putative transposase
MNRTVKLIAGNYYHFYNRGVNRQPIFFFTDNWGFFIREMRRYFLPEYIDILAYCLMPNHYHLLVYLKTDEISKKVMQPFGTSYVKAINRQQGRVGPLFQGPFKARQVDNAAYFAHLTRYIHLNPVRAKLADGPAEWPFSSYNDYTGARRGSLPNTEIVLAEFDGRDAYRAFVEGEERLDAAGRKVLRSYVAFD